MSAAAQYADLHELVDRLSPPQADAVRAVVVQFVAPVRDAEQTPPTRRKLSFAGTLSAEPDLAERSEQILNEIITRNAG